MNRVVFLHRPGQVNMGGKIMRCDQLSVIASKHLGDRYHFEVASPPPRRRPVRQRRFAQSLDGAIVILLKNALSAFTPSAIHVLRARVRGLCIDHLDIPASQETLGLADVHIAASFRGRDILEKTLTSRADISQSVEVMHLAHHADPRLTPAQDEPENFGISYFGKLSNTYLPAAVAGSVQSPDYGRDYGFSSVIEAMRSCPMHYCVRERSARPAVSARQAKPFTKGFNAAAVDANVLVNRQVDDAIAYLGEDYPFLIDDASEQSILEGIARARDLYGSPEWRRGLEVMREVRARTAPEEIARQLGEILALF
ncbi:hypothetical protein FGK63_07775 [Ruegeria sediminis]|uniref:Glycosyltransferase family 1 protein n=1 Tax=Ruegeria sediminis TaxID=2583820 RepID=A0ABY2X188_9RHOB|nr:hypothetical protein [Ruegeria sediminis]TMV09010.1 hypothetical protein FGK63_07775 [Ruegeria sediminis]